MKKYIPTEVEKNVKQRWSKSAKKLNFNKPKKPYYLLVEFPYSSGDLHIGHWFAFAVTDIFGRYKQMQGFDVFFPIGFDSFGLPAENAAIKHKLHPRDWTLKNIETMRKQFQLMGAIHDWDHEVVTCLPQYYKWNQWIFLKMLERGVAYRGKTLSNWCPVDQTVLADEQVIAGKCDRCGSEVELKEIPQWFLKITDYADKLLWRGTENVDWPKSVVEGQNNWIGKSDGALIDFEVENQDNFVLIHGFTATKDDNLLPWLKQTLEDRGHKVWLESLPNTNDPDIQEQVDFILKSAKFDENTVIWAHSLGSVVALKLLEKLKTPIKKLVLGAGFMEPGFLDHERPFEKKFDWIFDFEKIRKNAGEVIILRAQNDTAVPQERTDYIKSKIGGTIFDFVAQEDHINGKVEPVVLSSLLSKIQIFTTAIDTIFGVTFMVISPEHPLVLELTTAEHKKEVEAYIAAAGKKTQVQRMAEEKTKTGVFCGSYAISPFNNKKVPIWVADYVLMSYGTGAVMAVPAHDERDHEFAKKFKLPIVPVIKPEGDIAKVEVDGFWDYQDIKNHHQDTSVLFDSGHFDDMTSKQAKAEMLDYIEEVGVGKRQVQYHLHDWSISRQRYWGTPIPIINCPKCGAVPVPEKDLPVELPYEVDHAPKGKPPLATAEAWMKVKCPNCGGDATREPETMDGFFDNSWYMYRYLDPKNKDEIFEKAHVKTWMPVDIYFGGAEHTLGHTLYSRFFTKFFKDIGLVHFDEYAKKRVNHGVILGPDGSRMSKSRGNVVNPDEEVKKYGADAIRTYLAFIGPYDLVAPWDPGAINGVFNFLSRVWKLAESVSGQVGKLDGGGSNKKPTNLQTHRPTDLSDEDLQIMNKTIKKVGEDLEAIKFNTAVAALMEWLNYLSRKAHLANVSKVANGTKVSKEEKKSKTFETSETFVPFVTSLEYTTFLKLLAPFAPHMTEELWEMLQKESKVAKESKESKVKKISDSIHDESWPEYEEALTKSKQVTIVVQVNGKVREKLLVEAGIAQKDAEKFAVASQKVQVFLGKKAPQKVIFIPDRLLNLVV